MEDNVQETVKGAYERGKADGIKEGMDMAALIAEGRAKYCISGCCKWTAKEIRSAKEKL